jgi:uncharacterized membrane protein
MRSRAAINGHPLHPAVVAIPIGAFTITLVADIVTWATGSPGWIDTARYALIIGVAGALWAAVLGFVDFFGVTMSPAGARVARIHMILNLTAVVLFAVSLWMRQTDPDHWSTGACTTSTIAFLVVGVSGWLGGELVFKHKVGVVETADAEATELGRKETRAM